MNTKYETLLKTKKTLFSVQDFMVLWNMQDKKKVWSVIRYYLRIGKLLRVYSGIYSIEATYNPLELAGKLIAPSYITFTTALREHGIVFQYEGEIHSMAYQSKIFTIENQDYVYHQLKPEIIGQSMGIEKKSGYSLAGKERAICDTLYLVPSFAFEHIENVDTENLREISLIYGNKTLEKRVEEMIGRIRGSRA